MKMPRRLLSTGLVLAIAGSLLTSLGAAATDRAAKNAAAVVPAATNPAGWNLVWSDEFNYTGLPDAKKWSYEVGYVRNNEAQYYTEARPENARVENGVLILECRKDNYPLPPGAPKAKGKKVATYTSASIHTRGHAAWTYGRMEVRAKIPHGKGVWPAIWMLGENVTKVGWPACGENDIMEFVGKQPDKIHGTLHFKDQGKHRAIGSAVTVEKPWDAFHVYAMEWTPEQIDFFYDNTKYKTIMLHDTGDGNAEFQKPFYMILNFALGGSWGGKIDDSILPQKFEVDYVRVFHRTPQHAKH